MVADLPLECYKVMNVICTDAEREEVFHLLIRLSSWIFVESVFSSVPIDDIFSIIINDARYNLIIVRVLLKKKSFVKCN